MCRLHPRGVEVRLRLPVGFFPWRELQVGRHVNSSARVAVDR